MFTEKIIRPSRLWAMFMAFIGICLLIAGSFYSIDQYTFQKDALYAKGTIVELIEEENDGKTMSRPIITFTTTLGETFTFTSTYSSRPPIGYPGDDIDVLYHISTPEHARIETNFFNYSYTLSSIFSGILSILIGVFSYKRYRKYNPRMRRWKCSNCGVNNSMQFDSCYSCHHKRELGLETQ